MPAPVRFRLARQAVQVPNIEGIARRQQEIERAKRPPERQRSPSGPVQPQSYAQERIAKCLDRIRSSASGGRHPTYVTEAARARAICEKHGLDWASIRRELSAAHQSTLTSTEARRRRKASTEGVLSWLEGRAA